MNKLNFKRTLSAALSAALVLTGTSLPSSPSPENAMAADTVRKFEFEDGKLVDCEESQPITWEQVDEDAEGNPCDMTGWSGDSYVYIDDKDSYVELEVNVETEGFYQLKINYIQCFGTPHKIQYLLVNGESQGEVCFPFNSGKGWELLDAGYVHLNAGKNTIQIKSYWGYTFLDYLTLSPAPDYITKLEPTKSLCNPNATKEAKNLYAYLTSIYGKHILAGQQEYCGSHNYNKDAQQQQGLPIDYLVDNEKEFDHIQKVTGKQPAVRGIDFLFYNTTQSYADDAPERVIAWYKDKGGIPTVTYHWNVPTEKDSKTTAFYVESTGNTPFTTFSVTNALTEGTWEHDVIDADIALLAEQFKKIQDAGVPVIFRPLHEAEGAWFWWGAEGPEPCMELYHYLWDKLTNEYGINNLIWEWTSSTYSTSLAWYPGDDYVDLIGCDKYNAVNYQPNLSAISATFYSLVAQTTGQKMVAMSENDTIPSLENLESSKAGWLYFCPWYGNYLTDLNSDEELDKIYNSDYCITLDELPDFSTYSPDTDEPTSETTQPSSDDEDVVYGDANDDGTISVADATLIMQIKANPDSYSFKNERAQKNADCQAVGDGITSADALAIQKYLANSEDNPLPAE